MTRGIAQGPASSRAPTEGRASDLLGSVTLRPLVGPEPFDFAQDRLQLGADRPEGLSLRPSIGPPCGAGRSLNPFRGGPGGTPNLGAGRNRGAI